MAVGLDGEDVIGHQSLLGASDLALFVALVSFLHKYSTALQILGRLVVDFHLKQRRESFSHRSRVAKPYR